MATKGLWQSMTGWIKNSDEAPSPQQSQPANDPAATPPAADFSAAKREPLIPSAPLPLSPNQPFGASPAPAATPSAGAQPALDPDPRPDEGPEINRKILDIIRTCYDPEIPVNILELGLIYAVNVDDEGNALITMTLTAPNCPAAQSLPNEVKFKVEAMDEIKSAHVEIVFDPPWTPNKMSDAAKLTLNIL
jgi:FeS assembly SUF system protein